MRCNKIVLEKNFQWAKSIKYQMRQVIGDYKIL